jgi:hypothetical protein
MIEWLAAPGWTAASAKVNAAIDQLWSHHDASSIVTQPRNWRITRPFEIPRDASGVTTAEGASTRWTNVDVVGRHAAAVVPSDPRITTVQVTRRIASMDTHKWC